MGLEILRTISDHSLVPAIGALIPAEAIHQLFPLQETPVASGSSDFPNGIIAAGVGAGVATLLLVAPFLYGEISQIISDSRNARRIRDELHQLLESGQPHTRPEVDKMLGQLSAAYYQGEMRELVTEAFSRARNSP